MDNNSNLGKTDQDAINVRDLLFRYLNKWYWFVFAVLISLTLTWFFLKTQNEKYTIQTTIMLRNESRNGGVNDQKMMMESMGLFNGSKALDDEIQVISSHKLVRQAVDTLNLYVEYYKKDKWKYVEQYNNTPFRLVIPAHFSDTLKYAVEIKLNLATKTVIFKSKRLKETYELNDLQQPFQTPVGQLSFVKTGLIPTEGKYLLKVRPTRELEDDYTTRIQANSVNKQVMNVIRISMVEANIKKAQDLLDKIVELYNLDAIVDKNLVATNTANFLRNQLNSIKQELSNVESNVEQYKKTNSITDISSEAAIYLESSSEYNKKLVELETQMRLIQYVENYLKNNKNQYSLIPTNIGIDDKGLVDVIQGYNLAVLERMKLVRSSNKINPALVDLEEQINAMRTNILSTLSSVKGGLAISKNDVVKKEGEFKSRIKAVPTQERQFLEIKRQQEITQNLYVFLYQKQIENALKLASTASAARTIDKAYASLTPVAPKKGIALLVGLILGLLIPFLIIYLRDLINNKIEDPKEFKKAINAPYLGNVCISRETERVVVQEGKVTPIVEMFRLIRTNLQFMTASKKSPAILVTSTISGEGKSFISINIAMSFALMKKKVVLVGMDIRNPMLGEYLHIPKTIGLTVYLSDDSYMLKDILVPSGFHKYLDVIPAGPVPPNPSELLMTTRLEDLIKKLKEDYDYIIIDSAPIGIVSDTYLLNRIVDNSIFVARQDYSSQESIHLINEIYSENKLNDMGVILNGTSATGNYGYGYGYGTNYQKRQNRRAIPKLTLGDKINDWYHKLVDKD